MAKRSKKQEQGWYWVEGRAFDSRGIRHWYPIYNERIESRAEALVRRIERWDDAERRRQCVDRYDEFRVVPERDHLAELYADNKKAKKGICPSCGKKPSKHKTGTWKFHKAMRCSRCGHTWCIPGTLDVAAWEADQVLRAERERRQREEEEARRQAAELDPDSDALAPLKSLFEKSKPKKPKKKKKSKKKSKK